MNVTKGDGIFPSFPAGFTWGAATAAYQIEGAVTEDGRGTSIWDTFSRTPGKVHAGDTGDVACDSYHRYAEDADLLKSYGLSSYRFSIAWPRIFPSGDGQVNQAGLDYYKRLLDALAERGISGAATLFHWDLPQALQDKGGFASRDVALRYADYAATVADALGDRVGRWMTLNEPHVYSVLGHLLGIHAPGLTDPAAFRAATHHLLVGHGLAVQALRATLPSSAEVGIALSFSTVRVEPQYAGIPVVEAARALGDATGNDLFLDPIVLGRYPEHAPADVLPPAELVKDGDMELIGAPIDFLGLNYYFPTYLRPGDPDNLKRHEEETHLGRDVVAYQPEGMSQTNMGWPWVIDPGGLYELLMRVSKKAPGLPLYVTENGRAAEDYVDPNGAVNDVERIEYLHGHLSATARAAQDGANVAGYYVWSLLDNFEWAYGYQKRFGITYVDFGTGKRTPKASARWFAEAARTNAVPPLPEGIA
jgi:beta-glucosidase